MQLARISILNFRNFSALDVELAGNVVVVGENRVGKSNFALRCAPSAGPDAAGQRPPAGFLGLLGRADRAGGGQQNHDRGGDLRLRAGPRRAGAADRLPA